jgi:hypothetical protein
MNPITRVLTVIVHDHAETPSAITLKSASTIAEMRSAHFVLIRVRIPASAQGATK